MVCTPPPTHQVSFSYVQGAGLRGTSYPEARLCLHTLIYTLYNHFFTSARLSGSPAEIAKTSRISNAYLYN